LRSRDRHEEGICTEEGESVSIVKRRERRDVRIHTRTIEERVHQTLKVASNGTGVFRRKVGFLGVVIGLKWIKMEEEKVKSVLDWPTPQCVKDVQKFLELANYYCRFIEGFASIARSLHDMIKKDKK